MIDLAPRHKIGLTLPHPLMVASGFGGYGQLYRDGLNLNDFAALVTSPITLRPQAAPAAPQVAETLGGFVLNNGLANPGVKRVIQQYQKTWARLTLPIIAHLPLADPADLARTAQALTQLTTPQGHPLIAAFELGLAFDTSPDEVKALLQTLQQLDCPPLWVKLPLGGPLELVSAAESADALVMGTPPLGTAKAPSGEWVTGLTYGAALISQVLYELHLIRDLTSLPLIATGGIHRLADLEAFLDAGAAAVQLDSLMWVDPEQAAALLTAVQSKTG